MAELNSDLTEGINMKIYRYLPTGIVAGVIALVKVKDREEVPGTIDMFPLAADTVVTGVAKREKAVLYKSNHENILFLSIFIHLLQFD